MTGLPGEHVEYGPPPTTEYGHPTGHPLCLVYGPVKQGPGDYSGRVYCTLFYGHAGEHRSEGSQHNVTWDRPAASSGGFR